MDNGRCQIDCYMFTALRRTRVGSFTEARAGRGQLLLLAGVHLIAVLYHAGFMKENLIGAMFTGVKRLPTDTAGGVVARFASPWLALVLLAVAAFAVYLIVKRPF